MGFAFFAQVARPTWPQNNELDGLYTALNWVVWIGIVACLCGVLYGAAVWGLGSLFGGQGGQSKGRTYVIAGLVGSLVLGLGPVVLNSLQQQASATTCTQTKDVVGCQER